MNSELERESKPSAMFAIMDTAARRLINEAKISGEFLIPGKPIDGLAQFSRSVPRMYILESRNRHLLSSKL